MRHLLTLAGLLLATVASAQLYKQAPVLLGAVPGADQIAIGDVNRDGIPDVVAINPVAQAVVVLGARLPSLQTDPYTGSARAIRVADLDGDGNPDIVLALSDGAGNGAIGVYRGRGDGTFDPIHMFAPRPGEPVDMVVGDINKDGIPDIVVLYAGAAGRRIDAVINLGGATRDPVSFDLKGAPTSIAIGDVDSDGYPDLIFTDPSDQGGSYTVMHGVPGTSTLQFVPETVVTAPISPTSVVVADLDGDGLQDIVVTDGAGLSITVFKGTTTGKMKFFFSEPVAFAAGRVAVGDLNGDGFPDLVLTEPGGSQWVVMQNDGKGVLHTGESHSVTSPTGIAVGDLDGDGKLDVAVGAPKDGAVFAYLTKPLGPTANAGPDQTVEAGPIFSFVKLDGSGSKDPQGRTLAYQWSLSGRPMGSSASITAPLFGTGKYEFTLVVTDPDGRSASDTVVVTIVDTTPPGIYFPSVNPTSLPPSGKMVAITVFYFLFDNTDFSPTATLSVTSTDPAPGQYQIVDAHHVRVLATKTPGSNRRYTITITARDRFGNEGARIAGTVVVQ